MSIRLRHHLSILPLFLGLVLLNGALVYFLDRGEIRWGLQQRGQSTAAVLAGFLDSLRQLPEAEQQRRLQAFDERLDGVGAQLLTRSASGWQAEWLIAHPGDPIEPPGPEQLARLTDGKPASRVIESAVRWKEKAGQRAADRVLGYATLSSDDRGPLSVLATVQNDRQLQQATSALIERLAWLAAGLMLVGVVVAELLTRYSKRELHGLNKAAAGLADGQYLSTWPMGRIRELNDLGSTLLTMTSLLSDGSHQTRRRFFEAELLPGDGQLANCLREASEPDWLVASLSARCAWRRIGRPLAEDFLASRDSTDGQVLVIGRCRPPTPGADEFERGLHAETLRAHFLGLAASRASLDDWRAALELFPCESLELLRFDAATNSVQRWTLHAPSGELREESVIAEGRALLGTLPREGLAVANAYQRQFAERSAEQLIAELAGLLSAHFHGLLLLCTASQRQPAEETAQ